MNRGTEKKGNQTIDFLKLFFAFCIVGIHTDIVKVIDNTDIQWYVMQLVFRLGVPFFFIVSGYFLGGKLWNCNDRESQRQCVLRYSRRLIPAYVLWSLVNLLVTLPQWYRNAHGNLKDVMTMVVKTILLYPTGAMWFVLACIVGAWILYLLWNHKKLMVCVALLAHGFGMLANTYYFVIDGTKLHKIVDWYLEIFLNPRNGVHVGFPMLCIGALLAMPGLVTRIKKWQAAVMTVLSALLLVAEVMIVQGRNTRDDISLWFSFLIFIPFLILFCLKKDVLSKFSMRWAREFSTCIFYSHCFFRTVLREVFAVNEPVVLYCITVALCTALFCISRKVTFLKKVL